MFCKEIIQKWLDWNLEPEMQHHAWQLTLNEINENGQIVGGHYIKSSFGSKWKAEVSDRAENLNQVISYHAVSYLTLECILKPLALRFKRSGLYTLAMKMSESIYFYMVASKKEWFTGKWMCGICPIKRYQNGSFKPFGIASFFKFLIFLLWKGDTFFLRGYRISDKSYNGFDYLDHTCSDIIEFIIYKKPDSSGFFFSSHYI